MAKTSTRAASRTASKPARATTGSRGNKQSPAARSGKHATAAGVGTGSQSKKAGTSTAGKTGVSKRRGSAKAAKSTLSGVPARRTSPSKHAKGNPGTLRAPSRKPKMLNSTHVEGTMVDGVLVAKLKCEKLGEYEAGIVQGDISAAATGTSWKVALDFTDVQLISSVGLGLIVTLNKAAKTNKGRMSMFNLNPNLLNLFKITRLDSGLLIKSTAEEAIAAVK